MSLFFPSGYSDNPEQVIPEGESCAVRWVVWVSDEKGLSTYFINMWAIKKDELILNMLSKIGIFDSRAKKKKQGRKKGAQKNPP